MCFGANGEGSIPSPPVFDVFRRNQRGFNPRLFSTHWQVRNDVTRRDFPSSSLLFGQRDGGGDGFNPPHLVSTCFDASGECSTPPRHLDANGKGFNPSSFGFDLVGHERGGG